MKPEVAELLDKARRNIGNYAIGSHLTEAEVLEMLSWAKEFLKAGESHLGQAF